MFNKVILMGRLTADPEVKQTSNAISVCSFSIAVDRNFQKSGEEKVVDFINLVAWRQNAEFIGRYFTKGKPILVEGEINTRKYEDKNGNKRVAFEVVVDRAHFCDSKFSQPNDNNNYGNSNFGNSNFGNNNYGNNNNYGKNNHGNNNYNKNGNDSYGNKDISGEFSYGQGDSFDDFTNTDDDADLPF